MTIISAAQEIKQANHEATEEPNEYLRRCIEAYRNFTYEIAKSLAKKRHDAERAEQARNAG